MRGLHFCYAYIDDLLIASTSPEEHQHHIRQVFLRPSDYGVINPTNATSVLQLCSSLDTTLTVTASTLWRPKYRSFVTSPYQSHIVSFLPHAADLLYPLTQLLGNSNSGTKEVTWTETAQAAFNAVKDALANTTLLNHPQPNAQLAIMTDASDVAVGAVLQQRAAGQWQPISLFSRKVKPAEVRYSALDRELLAIYLSLRHFRHMVEGREFSVYTDHKPLTRALTSRSTQHTPRQIRHLDFVSQFTSDIRHVKQN